jgi:hypothetical protein
MSGRLSTAGRAVTAALLVAGLTPGAAVASETKAAASCYVDIGAVTAGGSHQGRVARSTSPPSVETERAYTDIFPAGAVRLSEATTLDPDITGFNGSISGYAVLGSVMYSVGYLINLDNQVTQPTHQRVGGGWGGATFIERAQYAIYQKPPQYNTQYALFADGTLTRWNQNDYRSWADKQSATGFGAVKTMALISQTPTYDTFLANTRGGALYTIRLPRTSPLKPIVKKVRDATWQSFDTLVAEKCGQYGTLLVGLDRETQSAYLYAVGHANGTATVIQGLGKVPGTFADPVYFRRQVRLGDAQMLFGE